MSDKNEMVNLLNGLTMFEKEELVDLLIESGTIKVVLHDCCAGVWYQLKDNTPSWDGVGAWLDRQTIVINAGVKGFIASNFRDNDTEEQYKGCQLESVPTAPKKKVARKKAAPKKKEVTK